MRGQKNWQSAVGMKQAESVSDLSAVPVKHPMFDLPACSRLSPERNRFPGMVIIMEAYLRPAVTPLDLLKNLLEKRYMVL